MLDFDIEPTALEDLARTYGIRLMVLFGSAVTGRIRPDSDVDIAVLLDRPDLSFRDLAELEHRLQESFQDRKVDLSIINRADPLFLRKITEVCQLLYGSTAELQRLKIYAFRRYQDHKRFLEMERRYAERLLSTPPAR
jgi:predicted nucleotidyltransferase